MKIKFDWVNLVTTWLISWALLAFFLWAGCTLVWAYINSTVVVLLFNPFPAFSVTKEEKPSGDQEQS